MRTWNRQRGELLARRWLASSAIVGPKDLAKDEVFVVPYAWKRLDINPRLEPADALKLAELPADRGYFLLPGAVPRLWFLRGSTPLQRIEGHFVAAALLEGLAPDAAERAWPAFAAALAESDWRSDVANVDDDSAHRRLEVRQD